MPDASHGSEFAIALILDEHGEEQEQLEPFRSQGGKILAIAPPEVLGLGKTKLRIIAWGSGVILIQCHVLLPCGLCEHLCEHTRRM